MNVILVSRDGVLDTPLLINNYPKAQATFKALSTEILGDDANEIDFFSDTAIGKVNNLLKPSGIEVSWFVDIDVNNYKN